MRLLHNVFTVLFLYNNKTVCSKLLNTLLGWLQANRILQFISTPMQRIWTYVLEEPSSDYYKDKLRNLSAQSLGTKNDMRWPILEMAIHFKGVIQPNNFFYNLIIII